MLRIRIENNGDADPGKNLNADADLGADLGADPGADSDANPDSCPWY